jgi:phospholipase/carboxylesterase
METSLLECVELEPTRAADSAVIWMHGLGADGHDFPPIVPLLGLPADHGVRFVFPHAPKIPVTINGGLVMRAWYDIKGLDFDRQPDEAGVRKSAQLVSALIEREIERGIDPSRIVLAGFSQGGGIALHLGLRSEHALAGLLLLSTYLPCDGDLEQERNASNAALPIFQAHGVVDPMIQVEIGRATRDRLQELGYSVEWHEYGMQHAVIQEEAEAAGAWLQRVLGA